MWYYCISISSYPNVTCWLNPCWKLAAPSISALIALLVLKITSNLPTHLFHQGYSSLCHNYTNFDWCRCYNSEDIIHKIITFRLAPHYVRDEQKGVLFVGNIVDGILIARVGLCGSTWCIAYSRCKIGVIVDIVDIVDTLETAVTSRVP